MDPNDQKQQPQPAPQQSPDMFAGPNMHPSQYDFITNPQKPPKKSLFGGLMKNKSGLLTLAAVGLGGLLVIFLLISLIFGGDSDRDTLLRVARQQSSLIALADLGEKKAGDVPAQSLASSVKLSVTSDQADLLARVTATSGKVGSKDYLQALDAKTQQTLTTAETNGRFDDAFITAVQQGLTAYQRALQSASGDIKSTASRQLIAEEFSSAGTLLDTPTFTQ